MLSSLLTPSQTSPSLGLEKTGTSLFSGPVEGSEERSSGFLPILEQLSSKLTEGDNQKILAALITLSTEKVGESLPLSSHEMATQEGEPGPESLTGDSLLAYLMANSGDILKSTGQSGLKTDLSEPLPLSPLAQFVQSSSFKSNDVDSDLGIVNAEFGIDELSDSDENTELSQFEPDVTIVNIEMTVKPTAVEFEKPSIDSEPAEIPVNGDMLAPNLSSVGQLSPVAVIDDATEDKEGEVVSEIADSLLTSLPSNETTSISAEAESMNEVTSIHALPSTGPIKATIVTSDSKPIVDILANEAGLASDSDVEVTKQLGLKTVSDVVTTKPLNDSQSPAPLVVQVAVAESVEKPLLSADRIQQNEVERLAASASIDELGEVELSKSERSLLDQPHAINRTSTRASIDVVQAPQESIDKSVKLAMAANALADKIQTMVKGDLKHAFIRLDPPELGALEIRVQVNHDQTHIQIVSPSGQVREALESQSVRLREALAEQGLNMANLDVSDQQNRGQSGDNRGGGSSSGSTQDSGSAAPEVNANVQTNIGLVDQYV